MARSASRSRGCSRCLQRKVKCDERQPCIINADVLRALESELHRKLDDALQGVLSAVGIERARELPRWSMSCHVSIIEIDNGARVHSDCF
ncbi:hypothetical protein NCS56_01000000 [Fusarium sp. Ph1]|nr:hypothetical protein NCS56_01000000 [Fusarium sp. Ph1]